MKEKSFVRRGRKIRGAPREGEQRETEKTGDRESGAAGA